MVEWQEAKLPFHTIATIRAEPQDSCSDALIPLMK